MKRFLSFIIAVSCVAFGAYAGLVAKWDFNNYDQSHPASTNILAATVGSAGKPCYKVGSGTALVTDGTLGQMYVVAPNYIGADASATNAVTGLGTGNYAIAIPKSSHIALPIPDAVKNHNWAMKIRCWIAGNNVWHTFFNRTNTGDGDLFTSVSRGDRVANGVGGGAFSSYGSYQNAMSPGAWHTLTISVWDRDWNVLLDDTTECCYGTNTTNSNNNCFFASAFEPLTVIDGVGHLLLGADNDGEDNLIYIDYVELYDEVPAVATDTEAKMPRFEFGENGTFTFLMISDWHRKRGRSDTAREIALLRTAISRFSPSLVVFGGDNISPGENGRGVFENLMAPVMAEFKASATPLCVAFGNHDSEPPESDRSFVSRQEQYDWYKSSLGDLFVDHDVPELTGVGTGVVPVFLRGASKPAFKIYVADSGDHPKRDANGRLVKGSGWDNPHSDQIAWYLRESADGAPHIWIQHIIVPDANCHGLFVPAGEGEGRKDFLMPDGSKRRMKLAVGAAGICAETTCPPYWNTYRDAAHTADSLTLYDAWRKSRCMKGAFFGHDHTNTFDGMDANGIRLGMTKSFNCGGSYGDGEPGFRVFRVRQDGSFDTWIETEKTLRDNRRQGVRRM